MTSYYGPYSRKYYKCKVCGKTSWSDECIAYLDPELKHVSGHHHKQARGMYNLCEHHYRWDLRLMAVLRAAGYTDVGRDGVQYDDNGVFSLILWAREPGEVVGK